MFKRTLGQKLTKTKKSLLILGPRQTGKSTLIGSLSPDLTINLAHEQTFLDFVRNPEELEQRITQKKPKTVFLDEVQRLPSLLNTVQVLLDSNSSAIRFFLTGSSARKLKRGNANLLPGRIHTFNLGPLTFEELGREVNIQHCLSTGTLPGIFSDPEKHDRMKTLRSYAGTYLKEEIQAEALTRNLEGFSRFLNVTAATSGQFLDISKLSSQAQIPRQSAVRYFEILEETLIVQRCDSFAKSSRKRLVQHPRYFFFDTGVLNGTLENFEVSSDRIGSLFEHFIFSQIVHTSFAHDSSIRVSSYRTEHGAEVDFIVEFSKETWAIECKASKTVGSSDSRGLKSFDDFFQKKHRSIIVYMGKTEKKMGKVELLPWQVLLDEFVKALVTLS